MTTEYLQHSKTQWQWHQIMKKIQETLCRENDFLLIFPYLEAGNREHGRVCHNWLVPHNARSEAHTHDFLTPARAPGCLSLNIDSPNLINKIFTRSRNIPIIREKNIQSEKICGGRSINLWVMIKLFRNVAVVNVYGSYVGIIRNMLDSIVILLSRY